MQNENNQLEPADLEARIYFPEGDGSSAAQLTIIDRKTNLTVAQIDMTATDLVNFYARRSLGKLEGETRLLGKQGRAHLNSERVLVSVQLPFGVDVFEEGDERHLTAWCASAARAYDAGDFRVTRSRGGYTVSLMFFVPSVTEKESRYFDVVRKKMNEQAEKYTVAAIAEKGRRR